jgi:apolipoprotein N-acyltransferase
MGDEGADLLLNLTNDAWFQGSPAAELHLALAAFRAVEHRRYLIRATNDGVTAMVDPGGAVTWRLPAGRAASGVAEARWLHGSTWYGRLGDAPWAATVVLALLFGTRCRPARLTRVRGVMSKPPSGSIVGRP